MRKHIPHPVTRLSSPYAELDLLYGGNESEAIEESMKIAIDLRDVLGEGENILYVNTLVSEIRLAYAAGKRFDHGARRNRNLFVTYSNGEFMDKLSVLKAVTQAKQVKHLILTGFELAALDSRQRQAFMAWIRIIRNSGVNVILFTVAQPGQFGALGSLRYSARTLAEVGAYLKNAREDQRDERSAVEYSAPDEQGFVGFERPQNEPSEVSSEEVPEEAAVEEELTEEVENEMEAETDFADAPEVSRVYVESTSTTNENVQRSKVQHTPTFKHSNSGSLKTKELAV